MNRQKSYSVMSSALFYFDAMLDSTELEIIEKSPDKNFFILIGLFMITLSISLITGKLAMEELNN